MSASVTRLTSRRQDVRYQWAVFQRRPLDSLPQWKRWLVRTAYFFAQWQTADGEEKQAICTTEAIAKAIVAAGGPNWFYHRLPVDVSLPAATCKLDGVRFPLSEASKAYEKNGRKAQVIVCPNTGERCDAYESVERSDLIGTLKEAQRLNSKLTV
jgi:hypothetical protein